METANEPAPPLLGRLLDERYRLDDVIARGGMATVYLATDTRLDRQVAVKVMHRALAEDPEFVARFTREAKATARVSAPEVVAVHDQGTDRESGLAYLVMEHVQGTTLRQLLQQRGALPPHRAVSLLVPVLRALAAAHAAGLVHRDVKPENVLLADDGRVKVVDFGLARAVETSTLTQTAGLLIGTVAYLAPEQVETGASDARSDVYAAGVLLWELLTGVPPYAGDTPISVAYKHVHEDVPPPSTVVSGIPPALDALVVAATRRDPEARPADGAAFLAALQDVAAALPGADQPTLVVPRRVTPPTAALPAALPGKARKEHAPPKAPGDEPGPRRLRLRRPHWAVVLVALLAALALGSGYYLGSYRWTRAPAVLGMSLAQATAELEKAGLEVKRGPDRFSETVPRGRVLSQDPDPRDRVRKSGVVTVSLSKGPDRRAVPTLEGLDLDEATAALRKLGLVVAEGPTYAFSSDVPKDHVISSEPKAGTRLKAGTAVRLVLSKGKELVEVPNVTGKKQAEATKALQDRGFEVRVEQVFSDTVERGVVAGQTPSAGSAEKGSTVVIQVSKGPDVVTVPNVVGMPEAQARQALEAAGLQVRKRQFPGGSGVVRFTDPAAGKTVKRGSTVTIFVY